MYLAAEFWRPCDTTCVVRRAWRRRANLSESVACKTMTTRRLALGTGRRLEYGTVKEAWLLWTDVVGVHGVANY